MAPHSGIRRALSLFCLVAVACASVPAWASDTHTTATDQATILLIDRTTGYDKADSSDLDQGLYATILSLHTNERLIVRTIVDDPFKSERVFDNTKPGCVTQTWWDKLQCNDDTEKPKVIAFYRGAVRRLHALRTSEEDYPHSAIFATIAVLASEYRDANVRRVVVFSDLLENSKQLPTSFVLHANSASILHRLRRLGLSAHFPGAAVTIYGVGRRDDPARKGLTIAEWRNLKETWTAWFKEGGAKSVRIYQWYPRPR